MGIRSYGQDGPTLTKASGTGSSSDPYVPEVSLGERFKVLSVTPPLDTAPYGAGDLLFDSVALSSVARANGGAVILQSVTVIDKADVAPAIILLIADAMTDFGTANSAPNPDDTEIGTVVGSVAIAAADYLDMGANRVACKGNLNIMMRCTGGSDDLALAGVLTAGTPTFAATDLTIILGFERP